METQISDVIESVVRLNKSLFSVNFEIKLKQVVIDCLCAGLEECYNGASVAADDLRAMYNRKNDAIKASENLIEMRRRYLVELDGCAVLLLELVATGKDEGDVLLNNLTKQTQKQGE